MAGRTWDEIPPEEWENVVLHVNDAGQWAVQFDYTGINNIQYHYPEEGIGWDDFLYIYGMQVDQLGKEIEIWADT
jgi:hypothetical protein